MATRSSQSQGYSYTSYTSHSASNTWYSQTDAVVIEIDDEDLTFNGQPLSALYEKERYHARVQEAAVREPERGRKRDRR
jgi:hypothetical protein